MSWNMQTARKRNGSSHSSERIEEDTQTAIEKQNNIEREKKEWETGGLKKGGKHL
jgi:hypothetical protein